MQDVLLPDGSVFRYDDGAGVWRHVPDVATANAIGVDFNNLDVRDELPGPSGEDWPSVAQPEPQPAPPPPEPSYSVAVITGSTVGPLPPFKPAPAPPTVAYNPYGYVPGGSSAKVAQAIEAQAIVTPGPHPVQVPIAIEESIPGDTVVTTASGVITTFAEATQAGPPAPPGAGSPGVPLPGVSFNHDELEALWLKASGATDDADTAAAIAQAESGGHADAINNSSDPRLPHYHAPGTGASPEYSVGLWQINVLAHHQWGDLEMLVPIQNAQAAVSLRNSRGSFADWSTFNDGTYLHYLTGHAPDVAPAPTPPAKPRPAGAGSAWARLIDFYTDSVPAERERVKSFGQALIGAFK